jgi:hypothetical protein
MNPLWLMAFDLFVRMMLRLQLGWNLGLASPFDWLLVPVKAIGSKAFCSSALKGIVIPVSVETLRSEGFSSSESFSSISFDPNSQ